MRTLFMGLCLTLSLAISDEDSSRLQPFQATEWYMSAVSYWPFEDISNRIAKDHIGSNDGRIAGEFETVSGIVGSALALSGNDSWVDFGVLPSVCLNSPSTCTSGFTIAFWLKSPEFQGNRIILQLGQHRFSRGFTFWTRRSPKRKVGFSVNTRLRKYGWIQDWTGDDWTHIAVKWHATNAILKIYFNCTVVKVIETSGNAEPDESNKVSRLILGASHAFKKNIKLMIDEFAMWNRTVEDATLCKVFNTRSVHGNYSNWSKFSACSFSCGNGTKQRTRNCTNPAPANSGRNCSSLGPSEEHSICFLRECPIDGNFSEWSAFSTCSKTCGNGTSQRLRNCTNPEPKYGGRNCSHLGLDVEITECNTHRCPINGGLTSWSEFSQCDKSCGNGTRRRSRICSNPSPMFGGLNCSHMGPTIETKQCNMHACPVHGGYSEWTDFSVCTKSCGNGTKRRTRNCSNPVPAHGGLDCARLGFPVETQECNTHHCPINGDYTPWTEFSACSKSCGKGILSRMRNCSNPTPQHGGKNCSHLGSSLERRPCILRPCPIHGGFTVWSIFGKCSRPCGIGIRNRTRECTNPQPKHGGNDCNGTAIDIRVCNTFPCPVHGNYTPWSSFSLCSKSCGNGSMLRTRQCTNPPPTHGGIDCSILGPAREVRNCNVFPCPIHGNYSSWSNFSICSKTCGNGITIRMRNCSNPVPAHGGNNCTSLGPREETRSCNAFLCPVHGSYSSWSNFSSCSRTCGNGAMTRTRNCSDPAPKHGGRDCSPLGSSKETRSCFIIPCPVHGNYSEWSNFTACSKICGSGTKTRTRTCTNPLPLHNGNNCTLLGPSSERLPCNVFPCPVNGEYTEWGNFSQCSTSCGGGTMRRTRNCSNPAPLHGGRTCSRLGPAMEEMACNRQSCPIDGGYTPWSKFGNCNKTCGNGVSYRTRNCSNPVPQFGGRSCSRLGPALDVRHCNLRPCPIDGGYGAWSNFTQCTHSCNSGKMTRTRLCNQPMPRHGGLNCSRLGPKVEVQSCNTVPCPIHGGYSEWTEFMPCTTSCGGGIRIRRRNCTNPQPMHGGSDCTHLGSSIHSVSCYEKNCPDIVFWVTVNLTSETWADGLENNMSHQSNQLISKIESLVTQTLGNKTVSAVEDFSFRKGSVIADFSISLCHQYYQGITLLQDAIFIDGQLDKTLPLTAVRLSSTDVPDMAPANLTAANSSSRSIRLDWSTIPLNHSNGDIRKYRLTYYEATQQAESQNPVKSQMILDGNQLSAHVTALKKFTEYSFRIAGINRRGVGVDSLPVSASTDQDRPSKSPTKVNATSTSSTTIRVTWSPITTPFVHGILRGYSIHFINLDPEGYRDVDSGAYSTDAVNTSAVLTKRLKYTTYKIQVSGFTVKGEGPPSDPIHVTTDQDVPSKPPANVVGKNLTSKSIEIRWNALHPRDVNGILLGYRISYIATDRRDGGKWNETEVSWSTTSVVIVKLRKFTKYMVSVEGFTVIGSGIHSKSVAVTTDEDKPDTYPKNVTGFDVSSTELFIEWQEIPQQHINGILLGYRVFYAPSNQTYQPFEFEKKNVSGTMTSTTLQKLKKYTVYTIKVAGFTSKGLGPLSPGITRRTSEDVPSKAAIDVMAWNTSHTSISVNWTDIPRDSIHGILLGYRVLFWRWNESRDTYDMKVIGPDKNTVELKDLWIYTKYFIEVLGFTSVGNGTVSKKIVVSTDEFTPSLPPVNVRALNKTSPTKIVVQWNPIPDKFYIHGVLRGYRVLYKVIAIANDSLGKDVGTNSVTVEPTVLVAELLNLTAFTRYEIEVLAFTVKGDGVESNPIRAETCNCHSTLYTNWWINPPYVDSTDSNKTGIITPILKEVIHACCENCSAHGSSQIDFDRTAMGRPAQKSGLVQFKRGFEENTELHYPVYGFMDQTRYSNNYGFVPFVQSPGLALIIIGDEEGTAAKLLLNSLALCWPILFLSIVMLWVSSIALWFVETAANERHFPHNVLHGSWEAMWWAFASMTTLGYGDRIPRTAVGRMLCLSWILLGLVMVTCFNSTMTTLLTARILNKEETLYGTKIAAIQNSSEYRLAIRKNARVNSNGKEYTNLQEVYEALTNRDVKGILIDAYTVGSKKALFDRRDLRISKLLDYSSAYGVVLGGEGRKLQKCFQRYVSEQRSDISKIVEDNVEMIEVTSQSMTVERSKGLFDPQFPTYIRAMIVCAVVLSVIWMVGAKFELAKKLGWIKFRKKGKRDGSYIPRSLKFKRNKEELKVEMSRIVAILRMNCEYRKTALQQKHRKELLHFIKLQKQSDNKLVKKPSFHSDSIFSFSLGAKAFTRRGNNKAEKNGHTKWDSSQENEVETIV